VLVEGAKGEGVTTRPNPSPIALCAFFARDLFGRARLIEKDFTVFFDDIEPVEKLVLAGAIDAEPGVGLEQGAMPRADKMLLVGGMKMIGKYFQGDELMRAGIDIGVVLAVFPYHDYVKTARPFTKHNALGDIRCNLVCPAKQDHSATPPILQIRFHSAAATG